MTDRVSLPTLTNGKFTGRALTHITSLTQQATSTLKAETTEALATKADQATLDNFIGTLTSIITDSEAKTALASTQAAVSAERAQRKEADGALADRVSALEAVPAPDLSPYATNEALDTINARVDQLEDKPAAGIYIDAYGRTRKYIFVASDTDPGKTRNIDGIEYEVWWVQTTPPDPTQYVPAKVTFDPVSRSYTVPQDAGASYKIDGVIRPSGLHAVAGMGETKVTWEAVPKPGYAFKQGTVTQGSFTFPVKNFVSGDVMMSDSFERADGPVGGSTSDSFAGGIPYVWKSTGSVPAMITSGALTTSSEMVAGKKTLLNYDFPAPQQNIALEWIPIAYPGATATTSIYLTTTDGRIRILGDGGTASYPTGGDGLTVTSGVSPIVGDILRLVYTGSSIQVKNLRTGAVGPLVQGDPSRLRLSGVVTGLQIEIIHDFSSLGQIKVEIP